MQLRFELEHAAAGVPGRCDLGHHVADLLGREGLRQVVLGAALHRLDGRVDSRVGRDHDHRETRLLGQQPRQQLEPARGAEAQVQERQVVGALCERGERSVGVGRFARLAAHALETDAEGHADVLVVVDHQHAQGSCQRLLGALGLHRRQAYRAPACPALLGVGTMHKLFSVPLAVLLTLVAALTLLALRLPSRQLAVAPAPARAVDGDVVARHLAESIRFPTISFSDDPAQLQTAAFEAFHGWLAQSHPLLHRTLLQERVGEQSLLYTWQGSDASLEPILLLAHQDVVPADNAERWSRPPFDGRIEEGFVWGRGAVDDKGSLVAICEAVERLLADGYTPRRTVLLAFGHDEEVGGARGAGEIAKLLASRGVHALLAIDEGSAVVHAIRTSRCVSSTRRGSRARCRRSTAPPSDWCSARSAKSFPARSRRRS